MGDKHFEPLKKLGCFETSNQWILYDERYQKFFDFFTQNIRNINVLTEQEVLEYEELSDDLHKTDIGHLKQKLQECLPGLYDYTEEEAILCSNKISSYSQAEQQYMQLIEQARTLKLEANSRLNDLEHRNNMLTTQENELFIQCHNQAQTLETLQEDNKKLYEESRNCFTRVFSPPLLFHQMSLEQYFSKCDSFLQYFTLYIQENYKIEECLKIDAEERDTEERILKLKDLKRSIAEFTLKYYNEKFKAEATQFMIDELDLQQIHTLRLNDLKRELNELELLTEHHLKVAYGTLRNDLKTLVHQHSQQRIELVLYENTKHKLDRALRRLENDRDLIKITSNALSDAELVWILIQFDLERSSNRIDNSNQLTMDSQACRKRIKSMQSLNCNISDNHSTVSFLELFTDLLAKASNTQCLRAETKACLYEYEKFCRLLSYGLQKMLNGCAYINLNNQLKELKRLEIMLEPIIYDSPIEAPVLYNVNFLRPIHSAKVNLNNIENEIRQLRSKFQTNIVEKMEKEPLWRASQNLWVWFLKQPKRVLIAIEEVKRAATNVPAVPIVKTLSGIQRK